VLAPVEAFDDIVPDPFGRIDHQQDQVRVVRAAPGRCHHCPVETPAWFEDAWRVDEEDLGLALDHYAH
jgi:hypothetical protein